MPQLGCYRAQNYPTGRLRSRPEYHRRPPDHHSGILVDNFGVVGLIGSRGGLELPVLALLYAKGFRTGIIQGDLRVDTCIRVIGDDGQGIAAIDGEFDPVLITSILEEVGLPGAVGGDVTGSATAIIIFVQVAAAAGGAKNQVIIA